MLTNHGLYRKLPTDLQPGVRVTSEQVGVFRCGILGVYEWLRAGPFLMSDDDRTRAGQVEHHFNHLSQRFVFSLQQLNQQMQEMSRLYSEEGIPSPALLAVSFHASTLADHVLSYLGSIVDDVAQMIILATGVTHPKQRIESMGDLKHPAVIPLPALDPVRPLITELDRSGSWWDLAFKPKAGARQLLIHNHYLVNFQASGCRGEQFKVNAMLVSVWGNPGVAEVDFFGRLRNILACLCGWLDRLQAALMSHLRGIDSSWSPHLSGPTCPRIGLPVGYPGGVTRFDERYFPLPLCDGSDPLPWSVSCPVL